MRRSLALLFLFALSAVAATAQNDKPQEITWKTPANNYRQYIGEKFKFLCPKGGEVSGQLWGTELYTDDSSICSAAAHLGIITPDAGGVVTIEIRPGAQGYQGSRRNGIDSGAYGSWMGSFIFVEEDGAEKADASTDDDGDDVEATDITWSTTARSLGGELGDKLVVRCPEGGDLNHRVWGTDVYTDDSSVCVAAVHSGVIDLDGGVVTIEIRPGEKKYTGSRRNKVITEVYGSWTGSFVFVKRRN